MDQRRFDNQLMQRYPQIDRATPVPQANGHHHGAPPPLSVMQTDQEFADAVRNRQHTWFQTQSGTSKIPSERMEIVQCVFLHKQCKVPRCETARANWDQIVAVREELN